MRENSSKPVWADDDWLSTFAGKQALEHQRQDQGLPKETSESQSTETEVASTKAKRPAEAAAAEGMVRPQKNQQWESEWRTSLVFDWSRVVQSLNGLLFQRWFE